MQRPRTPAKLSESVHHKLNMYALVAGVGALALARPAEAKIIYTPIHRVIATNEIYALDLNHDRRPDFFISNFGTRCGTDICWRSLDVNGVDGNTMVGGQEGEAYVAMALHRGAGIDSKNLFYRSAGMAVVNEPPGTSCLFGYWCSVTNRYLGLKFKIRGELHYGWARLSVQVQPSSFTATLTGFAYETIPNKPIIAGKTHGEDDNDPDASLTTPPPDIPQPATLGALAMGAPGLSIWRREESAALPH